VYSQVGNFQQLYQFTTLVVLGLNLGLFAFCGLSWRVACLPGLRGDLGCFARELANPNCPNDIRIRLSNALPALSSGKILLLSLPEPDFLDIPGQIDEFERKVLHIRIQLKSIRVAFHDTPANKR
jgi:hypothetical protein